MANETFKKAVLKLGFCCIHGFLLFKYRKGFSAARIAALTEVCHRTALMWVGRYRKGTLSCEDCTKKNCVQNVSLSLMRYSQRPDFKKKPRKKYSRAKVVKLEKSRAL